VGAQTGCARTRNPASNKRQRGLGPLAASKRNHRYCVPRNRAIEFLAMKLVHWARFSWDLRRLPDVPPATDPHYKIRAATRDEREAVEHVISTAFTLDSDWADTLTALREMLDERLAEIFRHKEVACLVVTHGARIIGASALDPGAEAANNLISGPCILNEYRNRGLGSALLYHSLATLREAGLQRAHGVTKEHIPAAKFIYSKFNSVGAPYDFQLQLVGS
jgi:N-acetylglutamate synthase-like GNAT family acetyltransferase